MQRISYRQTTASKMWLWEYHHQNLNHIGNTLKQIGRQVKLLFALLVTGHSSYNVFIKIINS